MSEIKTDKRNSKAGKVERDGNKRDGGAKDNGAGRRDILQWREGEADRRDVRDARHNTGMTRWVTLGTAG